MQTKGKKTIIIVALLPVILLVIGLVLGILVVSFGFKNSFFKKPGSGTPDASKGFYITLEAQEDDPGSQAMNDTIYRLQERIRQYTDDSKVYQQGKNRIKIEISGYTPEDPEAFLQELLVKGELTFQDEEGKVWLTGEDVQTAQVRITQGQTTGQREYLVELTLKKEGTDKFAEATEHNIGKILYIKLDSETISEPRVNEKISSPTCVITGLESMEEAEKLAAVVRNGELPLDLEIVESNISQQ